MKRFCTKSSSPVHRADWLASRRAGSSLAVLTQLAGASRATSSAAFPHGGSAPSISSSSSRAMEAPQHFSIRVFSPEEDLQAAEQCCETIGQGFSTEPNNSFFSGDPSTYVQRWRAIGHNSMLRSRGVRLVHSLGLGLGPGPGLEKLPDKGPEAGPAEQGLERREHAAVALAYSYPEQKVPDDAPQPPGIMELPGNSRPETVPVREEMLSYLSTKKAEFLHTHGPFEYLAFLATRPEHQGKGLGSRLLRHLTDKADAAGRWCYLEATSPDNVRLYERHGFRQLETKVWSLDSLPGARLMIVLMARPPA